MRPLHGLTALLFGLCCADTVVGRNAILERQDASSTSPAPTSNSVISTAKSSPVSHTSSTKDNTNGGKAKTTLHTSTSKKGHVASTITTSHSSHRTSANHNGTAVPLDERLPIKPTITPAVGIIGVVLIITGVAYAVIGIKHQWLVVFLSAAYLTSLSVTVLVIYVMTPPVSDAIQGAYMVAALVTGLIFGGISLVFKEVTEGLGCLLGGFCLSMWFLVLKPGGLITSQIGKAVMIGVFCVVGWSLAFSQYTRNYGTIVCTAFAGAYITIIGIDCYSRAGLKEFWIYLWDLNADEFPIHTTTYPITRGMRAEIAAVVVLFLFGVMSQMKIWKVVKERKAKNEEKRLVEEERRDQRDSKFGKRVESKNERSLAQWEAVYGDRDLSQEHPDSGVGTPLHSDPKKSTSVAEREVESIEMDGMAGVPNTHGSKGRSMVMVREASDENIPQENPELGLNLDNGDDMWWAEFRSNKTKSHPESKSSFDQSSLREKQIHDHLSGPPVPPLPFAPAAGKGVEKRPDQGSAATKAPISPDQSVHERRGVQLDQLTLKQLNQRASPASLPRLEDDRASSVAATANDDDSIKRRSLAPSQHLDVEKGGLSPFSDEFRSSREDLLRTPGTPKEDPVDENDDEALLRSPTDPTESNPDAPRTKSTHKQKRKSTASHRRSTGSVGSPKEGESEASDSEDAASIHSLKGHLPESMSKVAMAYRTNEWAKHIADAEKPELEEAEDAEDGVQVEVGRQVEEPKPVDPVALAETADKSPKLTSHSFRQSKSAQQLKRNTSGPTPVYAFSRNNSQQTLQRQSSSASVSQPPKLDTRKPSGPMAQQPLLESPIEEEIPPLPYQSPSTAYLSTSNLLDDRNTRLSNRMTTTSFNAFPSAAMPNLSAPTTEPALSHTDINVDNLAGRPSSDLKPGPSEESLTLAQRKALIDQGAIQTQRESRSRAPSNPQAFGHMNSTSNQNLIYDSHQPKRSNTVDTIKQNAMLTQWRSSLQQDSAAKAGAVSEEQARRYMMNQRQQAGYKRQKEESKRKTRESMKEVAMRTGELTNKHQEALRKMQAQANTKQ